MYFEDSGAWVDYNTTSGTNNVTVENGTFSADFVLPSVYVEEFNVSLNWTGPTGQPNLACSEIYTINMINYVADFQVSSLEEEIIIYGDYKNFYSFEIVEEDFYEYQEIEYNSKYETLRPARPN